MKRINHLVLCADDLGAIRQHYEELGFTLCPAGQHPFGTGNTVIQLYGSYLELLSVTRPGAAAGPARGPFPFPASNPAHVNRHEGFSMMALDSEDAFRDQREWTQAGLTTYEPFAFSRMAKMPDGSEVKVGFSLAFVSNGAAPWLGLFACRHERPEYYAQPMYQTHANGAHHLADVWISGDGALDLSSYLETVAGTLALRRSNGRIDLPTRFGTIVLADHPTSEKAFGMPPPHPGDGPPLAGLPIACSGAPRLPPGVARETGKRMVVSPALSHGTAIAFSSY